MRSVKAKKVAFWAVCYLVLIGLCYVLKLMGHVLQAPYRVFTARFFNQ